MEKSNVIRPDIKAWNNHAVSEAALKTVPQNPEVEHTEVAETEAPEIPDAVRSAEVTTEVGSLAVNDALLEVKKAASQQALLRRIIYGP